MKWPAFILLAAVSFILLAVYSGSGESASAYNETKETIVLRKIVHELLLSCGDSTSRVLPVQQVAENEFHLFPERPLSIQPDSFVKIINKTISEGKLLRNFTASVVQYRDKQVVYGLALSPVAEENVVSCVGRQLPEDSYYFSFIFSPAKEHASWSRYIYLGCAVITTGLFFFFLSRKKIKNTNNPAVTGTGDAENTVEANHICIGQYLFNPEQQFLELNGDRTTLTIKECKVLAILANSPNMVVDREMIQKEVWENEGVIVTRSLDMFISKLRKRLSGDAGIKIVNVHGKGYKLAVSS